VNPYSSLLFWRFGVLAVNPSLLSLVRDAEGCDAFGVSRDHQKTNPYFGAMTRSGSVTLTLWPASVALLASVTR